MIQKHACKSNVRSVAEAVEHRTANQAQETQHVSSQQLTHQTLVITNRHFCKQSLIALTTRENITATFSTKTSNSHLI